jgi:hypothetical protein
VSEPALAVKTEHGRMYEHPVTKELYPSITNIIDVLDKPALIGWAAKETAGAAWDHRHALVAIDDRETAVEMLKGARFRGRGGSKRKADVGSVVHSVAEALAKGTDLPEFGPDEEPFLDGFMAFVSDFDPMFLRSEGTVFNETHRYAGTFDFLAAIGRFIVIGDFKTGSGIYEEVALQTAASRFAELLWNEETGALEPMPKVDGCIVVHLQPRAYAVHLLDASPEAFYTFVGFREAWPWVKGGGKRGAVGPRLNLARLVEELSR